MGMIEGVLEINSMSATRKQRTACMQPSRGSIKIQPNASTESVHSFSDSGDSRIPHMRYLRANRPNAFLPFDSALAGVASSWRGFKHYQGGNILMCHQAFSQYHSFVPRIS